MGRIVSPGDFLKMYESVIVQLLLVDKGKCGVFDLCLFTVGQKPCHLHIQINIVEKLALSVLFEQS